MSSIPWMLQPAASKLGPLSRTGRALEAAVLRARKAESRAGGRHVHRDPRRAASGSGWSRLRCCSATMQSRFEYTGETPTERSPASRFVPLPPAQKAEQSFARRKDVGTQARRPRRRYLRVAESRPRSGERAGDDRTLLVAPARVRDGRDLQPDLAFAEMLAQIGRVEGFGVELRVSQLFHLAIEGRLQRMDRSGIHRIVIPNAADPWTEDHSKKPGRGVSRRGSRRSTPSSSRTAPNVCRGALVVFNGWATSPSAAPTGGHARTPRQLANPCANLSYLEGGNVLTGVRKNGERYAGGRPDSIAVTQKLLSDELSALRGEKVELSEAEVLAAIAKDLGVPRHQVIPIEQPAAFHIDMSVGLFGPDEAVVHDFIKAAELEIAWLASDHAPAAALRRKAERPKQPGAMRRPR